MPDHDPSASQANEPAGGAVSERQGELTQSASLSPASGRIGPFVFVRKLGSGCFAPVWLAHEVYQETVLRNAAIKLFALRAELGKPGSVVHQSIVQEAAALCRVEHPNVVRFYSLAIDSAQGLIGLVMEHVDGKPLSQRLSEAGSLTVSETVRVSLSIASALAAVHRAGLVHRDLKPANVIESDGVCKLIDFGLATAESALAQEAKRRLLERSYSEVPESRTICLGEVEHSALAGEAECAHTLPVAARCGTVGFMDPVCMASAEAAVPTSDLYALGAILFQCLVGNLPAADALGSRLRTSWQPQVPSGRRLRREVLLGLTNAPSVTAFNPSVPRELAALIDSLLQPERALRPQSAAWVARRLEYIQGLLESRPGISRRTIPPEIKPLGAPAAHATTGLESGGWVRAAPQPPADEQSSPESPLLYDGVALSSVGNALLVLYQAPARLHRTRWIFDHADRLAKRFPEGISCLMVVLSSANPPDAPTRAENARRFKRLGDSLHTMVTVPTGDSLRLSLVRSVMRAINAAQGTSDKFVISDSVEQGIARLLDGKGPRHFELSSVEAVVRELARALDEDLMPARRAADALPLLPERHLA
ncbi:MAG: serine/threonine-protein kinase [Myxococcales bacterium]